MKNQEENIKTLIDNNNILLEISRINILENGKNK